MDAQRVIIDGEHPHPRQTNETFEHDRCTVTGHRSPDREAVLDTRILAGLLCTSTDLHPARFRSPRFLVLAATCGALVACGAADDDQQGTAGTADTEQAPDTPETEPQTDEDPPPPVNNGTDGTSEVDDEPDGDTSELKEPEEPNEDSDEEQDRELWQVEGAEDRPDLIIASHDHAAPGDEIELRFPEGEDGRGYWWYAFERLDGDNPGMTHVMVPFNDGPTARSRSSEESRRQLQETLRVGDPEHRNRGFPDSEMSDPGPDYVLIPDDAEPGEYRICASGPVICTPVTVEGK